METDNPDDDLRRIIAASGITEKALAAITGIAPNALTTRFKRPEPSIVGMTAEPQALTNDQIARWSILAARLTDGLAIANDERLKGIFESLTGKCLLTLANIAHLTGASIEDVEAVLRDPSAVPFDRRYELAVKGSYLINAVNQARGH